MVARGVIDNRQKGKVLGTLWLIGQESAIRLELDGNCDDDLAGCLVEFVNHKPRPDHSIGRFRDQVGAAGTITASRKVRTLPPDVRVEELNREMIEQFGWSNSLYLEWFGKFNGRVVVELVDPEVCVSEPAWSFTADEKAERQKLAEQGAGFVHMVRLDELHGDGPHALSADGFDIVVVRTPAGLRAFEGRCPHQGALLERVSLMETG